MRPVPLPLFPPYAAATSCVYPAEPDSTIDTLLRRLARAEVAVLLYGEAGCGKYWLARSLHARCESPGPLVELDTAPRAGAAEPIRAEAEQIVHAAGMAAGGFLVVRDLAQLSSYGQSALAEIITNPRGAPRVVACAHAEPRDSLVSGLRRNLVDSFLRIDLPPLRERGAELAAIVELMVACRAEASGGPAPTVPEALFEQLVNLGWPATLSDVERFAARTVIHGSAWRAGQHEMRRMREGPGAGGSPAAVDPAEPGKLLPFRPRKSFSHSGGKGMLSSNRWPGRARSETTTDPTRST